MSWWRRFKEHSLVSVSLQVEGSQNADSYHDWKTLCHGACHSTCPCSREDLQGRFVLRSRGQRACLRKVRAVVERLKVTTWRTPASSTISGSCSSIFHTHTVKAIDTRLSDFHRLSQVCNPMCSKSGRRPGCCLWRHWHVWSGISKNKAEKTEQT